MAEINKINVNGTEYDINASSATYATYLGTSSANYSQSTLATALASKASTSHAHTCTIQTSSSQNITLSPATVYQLTAGGSSYKFKTPAQGFTTTLSAAATAYTTSSSMTLCGFIWKGIVYYRTGSSETGFPALNYNKPLTYGGILKIEGLENSEYGELGAITYYSYYINGSSSYFSNTYNTDIARTSFNLESQVWTLYHGIGPYYNSSSQSTGRKTSSSITIRYNNGSTVTSTVAGAGLGWVSGQHGYWSQQLLSLTIPIPAYQGTYNSIDSYPIAIYCKNISTDTGVRFTLYPFGNI